MWDQIAKGAVEGLVRGILARKPNSAAGHVEAQSFVLRDDCGRGRAVLAMLDTGPGLTLLDAAEQVKLVLGLGEGKRFLELWGANGCSNLTLSMEDNQPKLAFYDNSGRCRLALELATEDKASFELWGDNSRSNLTLSMEGNQPELGFYDDSGHCRVALELAADGPCLRLFDAKDRCRAMVELDSDGEPSVVVYDENGQEIQRLPE
jgi:hypothetical protein